MHYENLNMKKILQHEHLERKETSQSINLNHTRIDIQEAESCTVVKNRNGKHAKTYK